MDNVEIKPVRGTRDVLPPARALQQAIEARIRDVFALYGYEPVDTPVLEPTDLFLRKSGEEIAARMYSFTHWNRNLCLRPEFTASVIRAYVNHLQDRPLPVRLQYSGPTFRYEKPQRGRHRQFTEVGIECVGAAGPAADAEVLAVARDGLECLGLADARFVVGHLGGVLELLAQLGMEAGAQSLVLGVMEHLSRSPGEEQRVVERLAAMLGVEDYPQASEAGGLAELLATFGQEGAARIAGDLLERANLSLDGGSRPPAEIVERLLHKSRRPDPMPAVSRSVEFIGRLREAAGPPSEALPALRQLLAEYQLHEGPVREIEQALAFFDAHFDAPAQVHVNLSLARGLRYYTGLVFEVYDDQEVQLAGGGRYDDLVRALGGRTSAPACGFSYGLERVVAAVQRRSAPLPGGAGPAALLAPLTSEDYAYAAELASRLRREGIAVEMDLRFRGPRAILRHADRRSMALVLLVGERERAEGAIVVRDMRTFDETRVKREDVLAAVRARLGVRQARHEA